MLSSAERIAFATARLALGAMGAFLAQAWLLRALGLFPPSPPFYYFTVGLDPMNVSGFLGAVFLYLLLPRRGLEILAVAILAFLLEAHLFQARPEVWSLALKVRAVGVGVGLAALAGLALRSLSACGAERHRARGLLAMACILPLFPTVSGMVHDVIIYANPLVWDQFLYAIDGAWGFQPAFVLGGFLVRHQGLWLLSVFFYVELPLLMVIASAMNLLHPRRTLNNMLACFVLLGVVGPALYNVVPGVGTQALAGDLFPLGPPPAVPEGLHLVRGPDDLPRNCMPSLHLAWILAFFWGTRWLGRRFFWLGLAAVLFTIGGTIVGGAHYFVDLVVGVPFALVFHALTTRATEGNRLWRRLGVGGGAAVVALSLAALRWWPGVLADHPALSVAAQVLMVVGTLYVEHRLARATLADGGWAPQDPEDVGAAGEASGPV